MNRPEHDPGIENEPHLRGTPARPDPSEEQAEQTLRKAHEHPDPDREENEHSVYNEPSLLAGVDEVDPEWPTYRRWLAAKLERADPERAGRLVVLLMLAGGPWAILGALIGASGSLLAVVVTGPVSEEIMKVAILVTLVELRPFLFTSRAQIHLAAAGSGLGFAVIENLIYLNVYIPDPSLGVAIWRWTVCVALHVGCSLVASVGIARMWSRSIETLSRPRMSTAVRSLVLAMVIHGSYNGLAMLLEMSGFDF